MNLKLVFHISQDGSEINTIKRAIMASQFLITHLNHALREYSILESRFSKISSIRIATTRIALALLLSPYEIRSADVLRTLDWENLETRWYLTKATFLYKVLSNSAAPILKDSFISRNILLNNYNLRNSQTDLTLPKPNREFLKRSFKYSGAYLWYNLPLEAKQAQLIYIFKRFIKPNF